MALTLEQQIERQWMLLRYAQQDLIAARKTLEACGIREKNVREHLVYLTEQFQKAS